MHTVVMVSSATTTTSNSATGTVLNTVTKVANTPFTLKMSSKRPGAFLRNDKEAALHLGRKDKIWDSIIGFWGFKTKAEHLSELYSLRGDNPLEFFKRVERSVSEKDQSRLKLFEATNAQDEPMVVFLIDNKEHHRVTVHQDGAVDDGTANSVTNLATMPSESKSSDRLASQTNSMDHDSITTITDDSNNSARPFHMATRLNPFEVSTDRPGRWQRPVHDVLRDAHHRSEQERLTYNNLRNHLSDEELANRIREL